MQYPDIDLILNLKNAVVKALSEYIEFQYIVVGNKANLSGSFNLPGLGTLINAKTSFTSNRGTRGLEEAAYSLRMIKNMGDDPLVLLNTIIDLLEYTRGASRHYNNRYSRYGCLVYHIMLGVYSSQCFCKSEQRQGIETLDLRPEDQKTIQKLCGKWQVIESPSHSGPFVMHPKHDQILPSFESQVTATLYLPPNPNQRSKKIFDKKVRQQYHQYTYNLLSDRRVLAYLSGLHLSFFEIGHYRRSTSEYFQYISFGHYGAQVQAYLKQLRRGIIESGDHNTSNYTYKYTMGDQQPSQAQMRNFFESQIKAVQIKDPATFCLIFLLNRTAMLEQDRIDKTCMQMIRKLLHIPKDYFSGADWMKALNDVHWLKEHEVKTDINISGLYQSDHALDMQRGSHIVKELANDHYDSLLDIHDGLAAVLLAASSQYLQVMGHPSPLSINVDSTEKFGTMLQGDIMSAQGQSMTEVSSFIAKYTFSTVDATLSLGNRKNGLFGKHGVSGIERAFAIKCFAEQAIQLRSRFIFDSQNSPKSLLSLCQIRLEHMINCFYQICYSLLDHKCSPQRWRAWADENRTPRNFRQQWYQERSSYLNRANPVSYRHNIPPNPFETVHRSSLICFINLSYMKFFEKEQSTLNNAQHHKDNTSHYRIPFIPYGQASELMTQLAACSIGSNLYGNISQSMSDEKGRNQRTELCWQILNHSISNAPQRVRIHF